ncbi:MAG TPA: hypothetical protein VLM37_13325 [Fibrobacteraceae bacterium]|nr:hypothetical protein [Fibrobacteraceae bacterium]
MFGKKQKVLLVGSLALALGAALVFADQSPTPPSADGGKAPPCPLNGGMGPGGPQGGPGGGAPGMGPGMGGPQGHGMGGPGIMMFLDPATQLEIGLSMDQQAKLKAYMDKSHKANEKTRDVSRKLEEDLQNAILQKDKTKTDKAKAALLDFGSKQLESRVQEMAFMVGLLSPEQLKKLQEITAQRKADREKAEAEHAKADKEKGKDAGQGKGKMPPPPQGMPMGGPGSH